MSFDCLTRVFHKLTTFFKSEVPPDHLSSSHSLLQILQFLDHSDILNCRLLNSRIDDVIQNNLHVLPRKRVNIIMSCRLYDTPNLQVYLNTNDVLHLYLISESHIITWNTRHPGVRQIDSYFILYGDPSGIDELSEDEKDTMETYQNLFKSEHGRESVKCYHLSSIEEGLRPLMRIIFSLFYVQRLHFAFEDKPEEWIKEWLDVVGEELRMSRSVCSALVTDYLGPSVFDLLETTSCRFLSLSFKDKNTREVHQNLQSPSKFLNKMLQQIDKLSIICKIETFDEIIELIKAMRSPTPRLFLVWIDDSTNEGDNYSLDPFISVLKDNFNASFIAIPPVPLLRRLFSKKSKANKTITILRPQNPRPSRFIYLRCGGKRLRVPCEI